MHRFIYVTIIIHYRRDFPIRPGDPLDDESTCRCINYAPRWKYVVTFSCFSLLYAIDKSYRNFIDNLLFWWYTTMILKE